MNLYAMAQFFQMCSNAIVSWLVCVRKLGVENEEYNLQLSL
jgi:hypothetical protein